MTSNGPGEFSGWVRPLVAALMRLAPETEVTLFFVPDDYATGQEPDVAARLFPAACVVPPKIYLRFALGASVPGVAARADVVQYLGGDLLHAQRVRARLGARGRSYKFGSKRIARTFDGAYAVDAKNASDLRRAGFAPERIDLVGNLAVDGALAEAAGIFASQSDDEPIEPGGILIMPGSRKHEIANVVPMFLQTAVRLRALRPDLPVAFAISPFTAQDELARALAAGGETRTIWGSRGRIVPRGRGIALEPESGGPAFPVVRDAMRHAPHAKLVLTLPGTKCIELGALGVPTIVCVPLNAPEVVVVNGPLQYIDRLPVAGRLLKRAVVVAVDARFPLAAPPNIDTGDLLMPEMRGTLMPGEIAQRVAAYADDADGRARDGARLRELYAWHAGAAERMARSLLEAYA